MLARTNEQKREIKKKETSRGEKGTKRKTRASSEENRGKERERVLQDGSPAIRCFETASLSEMLSTALRSAVRTVYGSLPGKTQTFSNLFSSDFAGVAVRRFPQQRWESTRSLSLFLLSIELPHWTPFYFINRSLIVSFTALVLWWREYDARRSSEVCTWRSYSKGMTVLFALWCTFNNYRLPKWTRRRNWTWMSSPRCLILVWNASTCLFVGRALILFRTYGNWNPREVWWNWHEFHFSLHCRRRTVRQTDRLDSVISRYTSAKVDPALSVICDIQVIPLVSLPKKLWRSQRICAEYSHEHRLHDLCQRRPERKVPS